MHICNHFVSHLKAATSKLQAKHFGISHCVIPVDKVELSCKVTHRDRLALQLSESDLIPSRCG